MQVNGTYDKIVFNNDIRFSYFREFFVAVFVGGIVCILMDPYITQFL